MSWRAGVLSDLAFFQRGFDITKKEQRPGDFPVVSSSGVKSHHSEYKVQGPGVVIGRKGTLGTCHYLPADFWPHDTTLWVKDFKGNLPRFVYYYILTMAFERFDVGGANPTLNRNHIHGLPISIPDLPIQRRIADILSPYDDLIETNERRMALLEEATHLLYREWFVYLRFPGHERVKVVDGVPEGWRRTGLKDITSAITRGVAPKYDPESPEVVINQRCIRDRRIDLSPARAHRSKVSEKKRLQRWDVLVNSTGVGTLGRVAQVTFAPDKLTVDTHVTILRPSDFLNPLWFGAAMEGLENRFSRMGFGATGQTELKRALISELEIIYPGRPMQDAFSGIIEPLRAQCQTLLIANQHLRQARDLLLPRLMNGVYTV